MYRDKLDEIAESVLLTIIIIIVSNTHAPLQLSIVASNLIYVIQQPQALSQ